MTVGDDMATTARIPRRWRCFEGGGDEAGSGGGTEDKGVVVTDTEHRVDDDANDETDE